MPGVLSGFDGPRKEALLRRFQPPCGLTDKETYRRLAAELGLQPTALVLPTSAEACARMTDLSPWDVLLGPAAEDPDQGMDRDLPDAADPAGDRRTMGGTRGPGSQGFRHMYFGGWNILHPVATFQIPVHAQGQAPERAELMAVKARQLIGSGQVLWGFRVLGWAMHYIQDLAQPFHSTQIPSLRMVPWLSLAHWPPSEGFSTLVRDTTRSISNFHLGYEGYVLHRLREGDSSPFADCLKNPSAHTTLAFDPARESPRELALAVAASSISVAPAVGRGVVGLIGRNLRDTRIDLANGEGALDYADLAIRPDLMKERGQLEQPTCQALATAALASRRLIEWALR